MTLAEMQAEYLTVRDLTISFGALSPTQAMYWQALYVQGEAKELLDACFVPLRHELIRNEIADVVLATVTLANLLGVSVEDCIAEKTEKDRSRG